MKVSVSDPASLPLAPSKPRATLNFLLALLIGLALGLALALLRERLDTTIKGPREVATEKLPALGVVPFDEKAPQQSPATLADLTPSRAEAYRQLRTNLQFVDIDRGAPEVVVVTSAVEGEGKTTTTLNLAMAIAEAGRKVIVVDGDLRRPSMARVLGVPSDGGLTSTLVNGTTAEASLIAWGDTGNLRILVSGPIPPNPSELLSSRHMVDLVKQLRSLCDIVLIDAPPLLPVTDAAILAAESSGALIVVRQNKTRIDQLNSAVDVLEKVDARLLGAVLNMGRDKTTDGYYGY